MPTRRYEQRVRAQQAEETRRRIIDAVTAQLRAAPSAPVRVEEVAKRAGVSRSTVYLVFGSKAGLFDAVGAELFERTGVGALRDAIRVPDVRDRLRGGITAGVTMFAADPEVHRALSAGAALDAQAFGGAVARMEAERADGMARLARRLDEEGLLRDDVTRADAEHVLWLHTSFAAFDQLFRGRGLPADEVARLLVAAAERAVLR